MNNHPTSLLAGLIELALVVGAMFAPMIWTRARLQRSLKAAGALGVHGHRLHHVWCTFEDRPVAYLVVGAGKYSPGRHQASTPLPPSVAPLELTLRPHESTDAAKAAQGFERAIHTGDEAFDQRVLVEAAPEQVAQAVLDPGSRGRLLEEMPGGVEVHDGRLTVWSAGDSATPGRVRKTLELLVWMAARLESAEATRAQGEVSLETLAAERAELRRTHDAEQKDQGRKIATFFGAILFVYGMAMAFAYADR